jgi:hypothetical protein
MAELSEAKRAFSAKLKETTNRSLSKQGLIFIFTFKIFEKDQKIGKRRICHNSRLLFQLFIFFIIFCPFFSLFSQKLKKKLKNFGVNFFGSGITRMNQL